MMDVFLCSIITAQCACVRVGYLRSVVMATLPAYQGPGSVHLIIIPGFLIGSFRAITLLCRLILQTAQTVCSVRAPYLATAAHWHGDRFKTTTRNLDAILTRLKWLVLPWIYSPLVLL